ncbi:MAG TPA: hypothetical protein VE616_22770 [Candidatus Udaeobacter sp.]|nr:hypothetical protein [Candidatus Udaeobacter sp.]
MPANAGIQVTDGVRHTVGKTVSRLWGWTPVFTGVTKTSGFRLESILSAAEGPE